MKKEKKREKSERKQKEDKETTATTNPLTTPPPLPPKPLATPPPPPPKAVSPPPPPPPFPLPPQVDIQGLKEMLREMAQGGSNESNPALDLEANRQRLTQLTEHYNPEELKQHREFKILNWLNKIYEQNTE